MTITPIETEYKGYRFRSRLEARWAVFFDAAQISWEYEKEGYVLSNGECYLPDFYLPSEDLFIEIKGEMPTPEYMDMLTKFGEEIGKSVLLLVGVMGGANYVSQLLCNYDKRTVWVPVALLIHPIYSELAFGCWKSLFKANEPFLLFNLNGKVFATIFHETMQTTNETLLLSFAKNILKETVKCLTAMKQARFEHGEKPQVKIDQKPFPKNQLNSLIPTSSAPIKISDEKPEGIEAEFDILWKAYPRKMGNKMKARKSYSSARKKGLSYEKIKQGLEGYLNYLQENNVSEQFTKQAGTWFHSQCWNDFLEDGEQEYVEENKVNIHDVITEFKKSN